MMPLLAAPMTSAAHHHITPRNIFNRVPFRNHEVCPLMNGLQTLLPESRAGTPLPRFLGWLLFFSLLLFFPRLIRRIRAHGAENLNADSSGYPLKQEVKEEEAPSLLHRVHHNRSILSLAVSDEFIFAGSQSGEILVCLILSSLLEEKLIRAAR